MLEQKWITLTMVVLSDSQISLSIQYFNMQFILSSKLCLTTCNEPNHTHDASFASSPDNTKLSSSPVKPTVQGQFPAIFNMQDRNGTQLAV